MGVKIISQPASWPILPADAKLFTRIDTTSEDTLIQSLIESAVEHVENRVGRSIATRTLELTLDGFSDAIELPRNPVKSVESIKYDDANGVEQTLATSVYTADLASDRHWIVRNSGESWPTTLDSINTVRIRYVAGYSLVPGPLRSACLIAFGDFYTFRESAMTGPKANSVPSEAQIDRLIADYRLWL